MAFTSTKVIFKHIFTYPQVFGYAAKKKELNTEAAIHRADLLCVSSTCWGLSAHRLWSAQLRQTENCFETTFKCSPLLCCWTGKPPLSAHWLVTHWELKGQGSALLSQTSNKQAGGSVSHASSGDMFGNCVFVTYHLQEATGGR